MRDVNDCFQVIHQKQLRRDHIFFPFFYSLFWGRHLLLGGWWEGVNFQKSSRIQMKILLQRKHWKGFKVDLLSEIVVDNTAMTLLELFCWQLATNRINPTCVCERSQLLKCHLTVSHITSTIQPWLLIHIDPERELGRLVAFYIVGVDWSRKIAN